MNKNARNKFTELVQIFNSWWINAKTSPPSWLAITSESSAFACVTHNTDKLGKER